MPALPRRFWGGLVALVLAAAVLGFVGGVVTAVAVHRTAPDPYGAGAQAHFVASAWALAAWPTDPADLRIGGVPGAFPPGLAELPASVAQGRLAGGFSTPGQDGSRIVEVVYWTKLSNAQAVAAVRDAAVTLGWETSKIPVIAPAGGAGEVLCPGTGTRTPPFVVESFAQEGRNVLTLRLDAPETQACPAVPPESTPAASANP